MVNEFLSALIFGLGFAAGVAAFAIFAFAIVAIFAHLGEVIEKSITDND